MKRKWPAFVSLDATNTLFRVRGSVGEHYARAASGLGLDLGPAALSRGFLAAYREVSTQHPNFGSETGVSSREWWSSVVAKSLTHARPDLASDEEFERVVFPRLFDRVWHDFTKPESWEVFPEAEAVIQSLKEHGIKVGLVSNWDERLPLLVRNMGWESLFDVVLTSRAAGVAKPDAEIFYQALRLADAEGQDSVHVGDDYRKDYRGALDAGFSRAFLIRRSSELEGGFQVPTGDVLRDLNDLLLALDLSVSPAQP